MLCLLLVSLVYHLNLGYILLQDEGKQKLVYVPTGRPLQNSITIVCLGKLNNVMLSIFTSRQLRAGALQLIRFRLTNILFSHRTVGLWLLDVLEGLAIVAYVGYVLYRGRSARFRVQLLAQFQAVSMLALAAALFYKHGTRHMQHVHIRRDWRLLYVGLAQLAQVALLAMHRRLPIWTLEACGLLTYSLMVVSSRHERLAVWK
jgi:hypothetical protein